MGKEGGREGERREDSDGGMGERVREREGWRVGEISDYTSMQYVLV